MANTLNVKYVSNKRRAMEIAAAVITGIGKIVLIDVLDQKLVFIIIASIFWIGYILKMHRQDPENLQYWGFTKGNFNNSFTRLLPFACISLILFILYGVYFNTLILNWHIIPILVLYPIWGVIQQFLVVGLVAGNLNDQTRVRISMPIIVILTATLFSIVHFPSLLLIVGTFILAVIYSVEYLKTRNLWVLGIYHGWLGCFFYFFVLNRDPFDEAFSILF